MSLQVMDELIKIETKAQQYSEKMAHDQLKKDQVIEEKVAHHRRELERERQVKVTQIRQRIDAGLAEELVALSNAHQEKMDQLLASFDLDERADSLFEQVIAQTFGYGESQRQTLGRALWG